MHTTASDTDLVERVQRGDHRAFAELVRRHDRGLRDLATRLLRSPERDDDAQRRRTSRRSAGSARSRHDATVATWLYRITYNTCLDELRRRPRAAVPDAELDRPTAEHDPAERIVARMEAADMLGGFTPEVRAAVVVVQGYGDDSRRRHACSVSLRARSPRPPPGPPAGRGGGRTCSVTSSPCGSGIRRRSSYWV